MARGSRILCNIIANAYTFTSLGFIRVKMEAAALPNRDGLTDVKFVRRLFLRDAVYCVLILVGLW